MDYIITFIIGMAVIILAWLGVKIKQDKKTETKEKKINDLKKKPAIDIIESLDNSDDIKSTIDRGRIGFLDRFRNVLQGLGRKGIDARDIPNSTGTNTDNESGSCEDGNNSTDSDNRDSGLGDTTDENGQPNNDDSDNSRGNNNNIDDIENIIITKVSMFDQRLLPEIRRTGCIYLVCAGIVADKIKLAFDCDSLNKLYLEAINEKYIVNNYITAYDRIMIFLFNQMGSKLKARHIGGATEYDKSLSTDATILCYLTPFHDLGGEHFKQGDEKASLVYDPANGVYDKHCRPNGFLRFHFV